MPSIGNALKKAVPGILKATGSNVVIRFVTVGSYNTSTGAVSESNTDVTVKALVDDVSRSEVNDLISQQDKRVLIAAKDVTSTQTTKDKVLISNVVHQIIQVDSEEASGVAVTFTLFVRA